MTFERMISWQTLQFLLIFFGPWLLQRGLATYRSIRSAPQSQVRPLTKKASYALCLLFISGTIAFLTTFPILAHENVYRSTQSRLQTPAGVLMTRLSALRPLNKADDRLRTVLDSGGLEASLLYVRYGPAVLRDCPFSIPGEMDASTMYLLYAAPTIMAPHLLHLFALAVTTSSWLGGREGSRWRTVASVAGVVLGIAEFWFLATYDDKPNLRSTRVNEIDFVHWKIQVWRGLAIAAVDALLGWVIWLQATGRAFINPPTNGEKLSDHARLLETVLLKTRGLGVLRNGTVRSADMRSRANDYWMKDAEVMRDVFEEPEVLQAQRSALNRLDITRINREADEFLTPLMGNIAMHRLGVRT